MSNARSIKKYINLFGEISMSRNHSLPDDTWTKVEDSNSPNHNDALCPLFYKEDKTTNPSVYDKHGNKYTVENGFLTKNNSVLFKVDESSLERFETKITDTLASYDGTYFYRAYHTENTVVIEKSTDAIDWEVDHIVLLQDSTMLLAERLYKNHYLAVEDKDDSNVYVRYDNETAQASLLNPANKTNNQIYVTEKGEDILVCVVTDSGPCVDLKSVGFFSKMFIKHSDDAFVNVPYTTYDTTIDVPATTRDTSGTASLSIANPTRNVSTNVCYKKEDGTYEDDEHNPITFTEGYRPRLVDGNQYTYSLYTTTFTYTMTFAFGQGTDPATKNATASVDVSLTNANYPVEARTWHLDYDFGQDVSAIEPTTITRNITITNNFGYIQSNELVAPTTTVTIDDASSEHGHNEFEVNAQSYQVNVPWFSNTGSAQNISYTVNIASASVSAYYNVTEGKVIYAEDGYAYTPVVYWAQNAGTYAGYTFRSTWTYDSSFHVLHITPTDAPFRNTGQTYGTSIPASMASIGYRYFRHTFMRKNDNTEINKDDIAFDPNKDEVFLTYDAPSNSYYNTGAKQLKGTLTDNIPKFFLPNGTRTLGKDTFVPLFNEGLVQGLSYNGTLVTPWGSVEDQLPLFIDDDYAFYKDSNINRWILVRKVNEAPEIKLVENRYVVMNTSSFWNCYDTELGERAKYAYDWNNRLVVGSDDDVHNNGNATYAGGVNVNFTIAGKYSGIASATWAAYVIQNLKNNADVHFFGSRDEVPVEFYSYPGAQTPAYVKTFTENGSFVDNNLAYWEAVYPLYDTNHMRKNPSIFADILVSGNNQDYFLDGNVGYKMLYEDSEPMILSAATGEIHDIENVFVIQSMPYAVIGGKIYSLSYLNGKFQGMDCIININGMVYIGAVPSKAYFYSPNSRAIYIFTGDANLTKVKDASAITDIYYITYNPATQTIYMATNNGLYMLSDQSSYKQDFFDVQSISFLEDGTSVIVHKQGDKYTATRFYYDDAEGLTTNQVRFDTGLLGAGEHRVFTIDKYNISLFSDQKRNGRIEMVSYILQDNGQIQEEKSYRDITSSDWDKEFLCKQIDFTPKYNKGVGVGLRILSDFAITNINASATVDMATQAAGNKWSI